MELTGKIINFLGDSITEGHSVGMDRYDNFAAERYNFKPNNYGIGGTRLAHQCKPSDKPRHDLCFCGRAYNMDKNADIIVVYGGVNDYRHGDAPFGEMGDKTPATFCGAVEFLMTFLPREYPNAKIIFMTPAQCAKDTEPSLATGLPLIEYVNAILEKGKEHHIPVLDLYRNLPIDPKTDADRKAYTADGLHFNVEGHKILAKTMGEFLLSL